MINDIRHHATPSYKRSNKQLVCVSVPVPVPVPVAGSRWWLVVSGDLAVEWRT
jgi:hypothetical protein